MQTSSEHKSGGSRGKEYKYQAIVVAFKEAPKKVGEEVIILMDEMKTFETTTEVIQQYFIKLASLRSAQIQEIRTKSWLLFNILDLLHQFAKK